MTVSDAGWATMPAFTVSPDHLPPPITGDESMYLVNDDKAEIPEQPR